MFPANRVLLGSPVPVQHCGPGFHSPFSVTGKLWSGSAQLGIKGRNKCEPPQSVLFIVTQDVQKSPDLNLACLETHNRKLSSISGEKMGFSKNSSNFR